MAGRIVPGEGDFVFRPIVLPQTPRELSQSRLAREVADRGRAVCRAPRDPARAGVVGTQPGADPARSCRPAAGRPHPTRLLGPLHPDPGSALR